MTKDRLYITKDELDHLKELSKKLRVTESSEASRVKGDGAGAPGERAKSKSSQR